MPRGTWRPFLEIYVWQLDNSERAEARKEQSRSGGLMGKLVSAVQAVKAAVVGGTARSQCCVRCAECEPAGDWVYVCNTELCDSKKMPHWDNVRLPGVLRNQQIKVKVFLQRVDKRTNVPLAK